MASGSRTCSGSRPSPSCRSGPASASTTRYVPAGRLNVDRCQAVASVVKPRSSTTSPNGQGFGFDGSALRVVIGVWPFRRRPNRPRGIGSRGFSRCTREGRLSAVNLQRRPRPSGVRRRASWSGFQLDRLVTVCHPTPSAGFQRRVAEAHASRSADRVSPGVSVTSAWTVNWKVGSSFSGHRVSGLAVNRIRRCRPCRCARPVADFLAGVVQRMAPPPAPEPPDGIRTWRTTR